MDSDLSQKVLPSRGLILTMTIQRQCNKIMTSLFQMLRDVIAGGGGWLDEGCLGWKIRGCGMSVPDLTVIFTKVSFVRFSPMKTLILNLSPTHRGTS